GGAAGWPEAAHPLGAVVAPADLPTADGLPGDAEPTSSLGFGHGLLKQVRGIQAAFVEHLAVRTRSGGFAIMGCHATHAANPTPLCHPRPQDSLNKDVRQWGASRTPALPAALENASELEL